MLILVVSDIFVPDRAPDIPAKVRQWMDGHANAFSLRSFLHRVALAKFSAWAMSLTMKH